MQYFISDTHFNDPNTFMYSRSNKFKNLQEMNDTIISNWNETVTDDDTVFHLGDVGDYNYLNRLKERIIVILGNHDIEESLKNCCPNIKYYDRTIFEGWSILSHKPIIYLGPQTPYLNIHGHLHNFSYGYKDSEGSLKWYDGNRYFNVSCEAIDYKPVSFDEIKKAIGYIDV